MNTRRFLRATRVAVGLAALLLVGSILWIAGQPGPMDFAGGRPVDLAAYTGRSLVSVPPELANADLVTRGRYLTDAADCQACHTRKNGVPFAGGRPFKLPFGTLYTPNITPDRDTGIGRWTDAQFLAAVHKGVAPDGTRLYPAFPYASYSLLTDDDVLAIKSYLFSLRPVRSPAIPDTLAFPFNQRWLMGIWSAMFNADRRFRPIADRSPQWNRGAYLVEAAAHCGECHTPRNVLQAMNTRRKFAGGVAEGWTAYNITSDRLSGVGAWSPDELASYLSRGHAPGRGTASGPMAEAVDLSLSRLTQSDVAAMVAYLRSVPAIRSAALPAMAPAASVRTAAGPTDNPLGKRIFQEACASCHAWNGQGAIRTEAQLTGNRAVNDVSAGNVAQIILNGSGMPGNDRPYMPAFRSSYTDAEIAAVANYVTARFGSRTSRLAAKHVARARSQ